MLPCPLTWFCFSQPPAVGLENFEKEQATPARRQDVDQGQAGVFSAYPLPDSGGSSDRSPANVGVVPSGYPSEDTRGSIPGSHAFSSGPTNPNAIVSTGQSAVRKGSAGTINRSQRWPRAYVVNPRDAEDVRLRLKPNRDSPEVRLWVIDPRVYVVFHFCQEHVRISASTRKMSNRGCAMFWDCQCEKRENEPLPPNNFDRSVGREGVG